MITLNSLFNPKLVCVIKNKFALEFSLQISYKICFTVKLIGFYIYSDNWDVENFRVWVNLLSLLTWEYSLLIYA